MSNSKSNRFSTLEVNNGEIDQLETQKLSDPYASTITIDEIVHYMVVKNIRSIRVETTEEVRPDGYKGIKWTIEKNKSKQ